MERGDLPRYRATVQSREARHTMVATVTPSVWSERTDVCVGLKAELIGQSEGDLSFEH